MTFRLKIGIRPLASTSQRAEGHSHGSSQLPAPYPRHPSPACNEYEATGTDRRSFLRPRRGEGFRLRWELLPQIGEELFEVATIAEGSQVVVRGERRLVPDPPGHGRLQVGDGP